MDQIKNIFEVTFEALGMIFDFINSQPLLQVMVYVPVGLGIISLVVDFARKRR